MTRLYLESDASSSSSIGGLWIGLGGVGVDQLAYVLEQALTELGVVRVDLTRPLGRVDDQAVLGIGRLEQLVDRRVGDARGGGGGAGHGVSQSVEAAEADAESGPDE